MGEIIPIYVGYDQREACVFHVFNQSVIQHSSVPVAFHPLTGKQRDGTNAFTYARFLVPSLQGFKGWAMFADGDMVVRADIAKLWALRDDSKAVMVVKHDYKTKHERKYIGTPMEAGNGDYPCKNWSSVILWNCGHPSNRILTEQYVSEATGAHLHRFQWLVDSEIGALPAEWNGLVEEQDTYDAKLLHWTLGCPGFKYYQRCNDHRIWNKYLLKALRLEGERPEEVVRRAAWRT